MREHGHGVDNPRSATRPPKWRNTNLPEIPVAEDGGGSRRQDAEREFATKFVAIGINAAFCKGNPVKIERLDDLKLLGKTVASTSRASATSQG